MHSFSAEGRLLLLTDKPAQPCHQDRDPAIHRLQKPVLGAADIGSLAENQSRGYFRACCGVAGTLQEMALALIADIAGQYPAAGSAVGGPECIVQLPGSVAHAFAVSVGLIATDKQAAG